jgi:hypothetical protein
LIQYAAVSHPVIRMKHYAYGHSIATLINPRSGKKITHKHSLTVVAVPSTLYYPSNYKVKCIISDEI